MQTNCPVVFLQQITTKLNEPKGPLTFVQILQWTVIFQQRHRKIPIFNEKMTNRLNVLDTKYYEYQIRTWRILLFLSLSSWLRNATSVCNPTWNVTFQSFDSMWRFRHYLDHRDSRTYKCRLSKIWN